MRQAFRNLVFLLLSLCLAGCNASTPQPLKVGSIAWAGYAPLFVAEHNGEFSAADIRLTTVPSSTDVLRLLESGLIDVGALTLGEALTALAHGLDLKVILIMDYSNGADVLVAQPNIRTLAELKGKRVAKEPTVIASVMLSMALAKAGLTLQDVSVRKLYAHDHLKAFAKGKVDAVITYAPYDQALLHQGGKRLFDSSQIPGVIVDVLAVRKDSLQSKGEALETLIGQFYAAETFMREHPAEAASIIAAKAGITPAEVSESLHGLRYPNLDETLAMLAGSPPPLDLSARRHAEIMLRAGLLDELPQRIAIADATLLKRLLR